MLFTVVHYCYSFCWLQMTMCLCVYEPPRASICQPVNLSLVVVRSVLQLSSVFSSRYLLHHDTLLFPQPHQVFLLFFIYSTYLDHVILIDVRIFVENDVGKVIRIVALRDIDYFSH